MQIQFQFSNLELGRSIYLVPSLNMRNVEYPVGFQNRKTQLKYTKKNKNKKLWSISTLGLCLDVQQKLKKKKKSGFCGRAGGGWSRWFLKVNKIYVGSSHTKHNGLGMYVTGHRS